jgi:hypothetical protein
MNSFGMLMNSPHSEFQRISPQNALVLLIPVSNFPLGREVGISYSWEP